MKTNYLKFMSVAVLALFVVATSLQAVEKAVEAQVVTKEEAAKKYPAPKGTYPAGEKEMHGPGGWVDSPYPPHTVFDCSKVPKGGLVLDTHVNKVFVRP